MHEVDLSKLDINAYQERARPEIIRGCRRCDVTAAIIKGGSVIVSPSGLAHYGMEDGRTGCGVDATGRNWWWPL